MDYLLWRTARSALRRARAGEHWAWWIVALALFGVHRLRGRRRDEERRTLTVSPGDRFSLSVVDPRAAADGSGA